MRLPAGRHARPGRLSRAATGASLGPLHINPDKRPAAVDFYTTHLGFTLRHSAGAAFADVVRGPLRVLLSGPASSGALATPADAATAGRNRIHLVVDDLRAEVDRLAAAGVPLRSETVRGPGGQQTLIEDPSGNLVELFQPAADPARGPGSLTAAPPVRVDPWPAVTTPHGPFGPGLPAR